AYEHTIECAKQLLSMDGDYEVNIVIVDNASQNDSLSILQQECSNYQQITVIGLEKNIGFARGNNYGYEYISKQFDFDFLIVSKDDIKFNDKKLISWIEHKYLRYNFSVLGPDFISRSTGYH